MQRTIILKADTVEKMEIKITELTKRGDTYTVSVVSIGGISLIGNYFYLPIVYEKQIIEGCTRPKYPHIEERKR